MSRISMISEIRDNGHEIMTDWDFITALACSYELHGKFQASRSFLEAFQKEELFLCNTFPLP